ncbi:hypothetical protein ACH42_07005 [Endozoicomonas sp. (ex Bugula neritina AB1)]|nr:hypothetical protein ACH42_07005 [Endozoicomonas sp. (ex Bugula neritina AB1)]
MDRRLQRDLKKLMSKNQGRCSICKNHYNEDALVYTCVGYDSRRKLQTTTQCCYFKLVKVLQLGFCGYVHPDDMDDIIKEHPLYQELYGREVEM